MAEKAEELTVAQRLGQALDRGLLPAGGPAEAAERLIERLERPARVALLGLPGAGKSAVLNLLAGDTVIDESLRLPTILVQRGAENQMICTLPDGTTTVLPGCDLEQIVPLGPALVTIELPLPALSVISLLEVSAGPADGDQRRAATWASKRADIVVWCSTSFVPKEQKVWESLPDAIKDNGFLLLSKTDLMGGREAVSAMVERLEVRTGGEFRQILPISALVARTAMQAPGGIDRSMFRDSGASAVIMAIKSRVELARQADTGMAELLLARHAGAPEAPPRRMPDPVPEVGAPPVSVPEALAEAPKPDPDPYLVPDPKPESREELADEKLPAPASVAGPAGERGRFSDRIKQMPQPFLPPVYQPPVAPRATLGRQPYLLRAEEPVVKPALSADPLRDIFARSEEERDEAALESCAPDPSDAPNFIAEQGAMPAGPEPEKSRPEPEPRRARRVRSVISRALPIAPQSERADLPGQEERPFGTATASELSATLGTGDREILETAVGLIIQRAGELSDSLIGVDKVPVDLILDHCRDTTGLVADALVQSHTGAFRRISADVGEALDLIVLMQLEKGHAPADDSVTLLIQLRRDLETLLAA